MKKSISLKPATKSQRFTLDVVVLTQDDQAGGYDVNIYNSEEELLADKEESNGEPLTDEEKEAILNGDDEYQNGAITYDTIEVEVDENGVARLVGDVHFHTGQ